MKKVFLTGVSIKIEVDEDADLSHLHQFEKSADPEEIRCYLQDMKRLKAYNNSEWYMMHVYARAEIYIRMTEKPPHYYFIHHINTAGLFGVESDSRKSYIKQIAEEELNTLLYILKELNVYTKGGHSIFQRKIFSFTKYKTESLKNLNH